MQIKIYQINSERDAVQTDRHRLIFSDYDEECFCMSAYDLVFEGDVDAGTLDGIYEIFNIYHPEDYMGRSLSVSDVVEVVDSETVKSGLYYCQSVGWIPIDRSEKKDMKMDLLKRNELREKIKKTIIDFICEHYGENEENACYNVGALANAIVETLR